MVAGMKRHSSWMLCKSRLNTILPYSNISGSLIICSVACGETFPFIISTLYHGNQIWVPVLMSTGLIAIFTESSLNTSSLDKLYHGVSIAGLLSGDVWGLLRSSAGLFLGCWICSPPKHGKMSMVSSATTIWVLLLNIMSVPRKMVANWGRMPDESYLEH